MFATALCSNGCEWLYTVEIGLLSIYEHLLVSRTITLFAMLLTCHSLSDTALRQNNIAKMETRLLIHITNGTPFDCNVQQPNQRHVN